MTLEKSVRLASLCTLIVALHAAPGSVRDLQRMSAETERLSASVGPKVVQIVTQGMKIAGAGEEQPAGVLVAERSSGSGFFVSADGYLFTNAHVVANATRIRVLLQAGAEYPARVVGTEADNDLALLKIDAAGMPFFDVTRRAEARQGQLAMAYGSPMGLSQSATFGMVSAVNRQLGPDDPRAYIQTDAPINPGNSGGPLVNLEGALMGINTMILSQSGGSEGIGLAVPVEVIRRDYATLKDSGTVGRARLGIQPRSLTADLIAGLGIKTRQGVLIEDVAPIGPGADAGLLPGDVIVGLNTQPVRTIRDLYLVESALRAGVSTELAVMRGPDMRLLRITPLALREFSTAPGVSGKENLVLQLGVYGATVTPEVASSVGGLRDPRGVLVLALAGPNPLAQTSLAPGDVLHEVNGRSIESVDDLRTLLQAHDETSPVILQIERGGMRSYVTACGIVPAANQPATVSSTPSKPALRDLQY